MSRFVGSSSSKAREAQMIAEIREITGAAQADAAKLAKKHKTLEGAIDSFYSDAGMQSRVAGVQGSKDKERKLGDIWEQFKDPSNPKLITIEGTMKLCEELEIDPENDPVLFCLAADLGSKTTGEWEKGPWVAGWSAMSQDVDTLPKMKAHLPVLRKNLKQDPKYFKKVYLHTFDLCKADGARTLAFDTAMSMWKVFVPPALAAIPSALSHNPQGSSAIPDNRAQFTQKHFDWWCEFQETKKKAISKDTWALFIDFVRAIDGEFKNYDEEAAWPSTIDDFVEFARAKMA